MGGCRCIFRDCTVATNRQPRMHFFRFPVKDRKRLLKWVQMANVPHLLELPVSKQKNKAVCARHFRDECFMNYTKEKLVATAVPTLDRLKGGFAIDYDGDKPQIILLPQPTSPYLIPPPGFECPLHLEDINTTIVEEKLDNEGTVKVTITRNILPRRILNVKGPENDVDDCTAQERPGPRKRKISESQNAAGKSSVRILNLTEPENDADDATNSSAEAFINKFVEFEDLPEEGQENYLLSINATSDSDEDVVNVEYISKEPTQPSESITINSGDVAIPVDDESIDSSTRKLNMSKVCKDLEEQLREEQRKYTSYKEVASKEIMQLKEALQAAQRDVEIRTLQLEKCDTKTSKLHDKIDLLQMQNTELEAEVDGLLLSNDLHKAELNRVSEDHEKVLRLKEKLEIKIQNLQEQQVSTVSTSAEAVAASNRNTAAAAALYSKAQLFNGIKKYLCSSMVSLVRMEMFGNAERVWKPDEKQVSMDLLRLGDSVYSYFTDEWRFRLPSIREVRGWLTEKSKENDDDEDL